MNFQEKVLEASAELRARAAALATRAKLGARVDTVRKSFSVLGAARREFAQLARRHAGQFVKQNSTLASAVRKDVSQIARSTYATLAARPLAKKARRAPAARKRSARAAA